MENRQTGRAAAPRRAESRREEVMAPEQEARGQGILTEGIEREEWRRRRAGDGFGDRLATGLGWFSIGLGVAAVLAPRRMAQMIGVDPDNAAVIRAVGIRELASGYGILTQPRPTGWVWSRVVGDAMDLALLGRSFASRGTNRTRLTIATSAVVGVTLLDLLDARRLSGAGAERGMRRARAVTINRPPEEVYRFWRDFQNLPRFMTHLESVQVIDERRSHWTARGPAGTTVEWGAEIIEDRPNERIAWQSLPGADVPNRGSVSFRPAPGGRGTEVHVELEYDPPGGALGAAVAWLFGEEPGQQLHDDLSRLKQVLEVGEIVESDASLFRGPHPAQPPVEGPALS